MKKGFDKNDGYNKPSKKTQKKGAVLLSFNGIRETTPSTFTFVLIIPRKVSRIQKTGRKKLPHESRTPAARNASP